MSTVFQKPSDLAPATKARSVDINNLSAAIDAGFAAIPNYSWTWGGVQDFTNAVLRAKTPVLSTDVANKAYVDAAAFNKVNMPAQPGDGILYNLTSLAGVASWQPAPIIRAIFDDPTRLAQAQATALSF